LYWIYYSRIEGSRVSAFIRIWKTGTPLDVEGPVHVSMNDYLVHRLRDVPRVAAAGLRFRRAWPETDGALGLWFANSPGLRRQVSVSVWRAPEDLRGFVRTPGHLRVMRDFRTSGDLFTNAWTAERFDRGLVWRQAEDRLLGRVAGVSHH
jgi:hypothetical protein